MLRVFLGDREPLLASAARWLLAEGRSARPPGALPLLDLEAMLVVVPGRRAGRRLLERLAASAPGGAAGLVPPTVATPGVLADLLGPAGGPVATEVEALWARLETLAQAPAAEVAPLLPQRPAAADVLGWLDLARELERLDDELAAEGLHVGHVLRALERDGAPDGELRRWRALVDLRGRFEQRLAKRGRWSVARARLGLLDALAREGEPGVVARSAARDGRLRRAVLVGLADLPAFFRQLLAGSGLEVVALVAAPPARAAEFDDFGCPRPEAQLEREIDEAGARLVVADRPLAQATSVAQCVLRWTSEEVEPWRPEQVTVATASVESVALVADALERAGLAHHEPTGRPWRECQPAQLLQRLADYLGSPSLDALVRLLRLPVVEEVFLAAAATARSELLAGPRSRVPSGSLRAAVAEGRYQVALDRYLGDCLAAGMARDLPGDPLGAALLRVGDAVVRELAGPPEGNAPSGESRWSLRDRVVAILERAFGGRSLDLDRDGDAETVEALELIAGRLQQLDALPEAAARLDLPTALRFVIATLEGARVSESAAGGGVEVVGWLEVALDDAPCLVVGDLVEGLLPASAADDPFLPDSLRSRLGLLDDRRRLARDLHLLAAALASRPRIALVTRRRDAGGQPARPSRLLLRRRGASLGRRLEELLRASPALPSSELWPWAPASGFTVPRPALRETPLDSLPVTAFDDYLACPYRFYLKRVLRLEPPRERPHELDAAAFGGLAHEVLRRFALGAAAGSVDAVEVEAALLESLFEVVAESLRGAVAVTRVQVAQLERRLRLFAVWQAQQVRDDWRIEPEWVEAPVERLLEVDGVPFRIHGRVDRVDRHPDHGWRVLDYKTGDRPESPAASHGGPRDAGGRRRDGRPWRSLQLPLYAFLFAGAAPAAGATRAAGSYPALGVYALSKKLSAEPLLLAPWTDEDLEGALECARDVVRRLRRQEFWPPGPPPRWDDGFGAIAGDRFPARYRSGAGGAGDAR